MAKQLTLKSAKELLHQHMQSQNLRRHCYAVGFALRAYHDYYESQQRQLGSLSADEWEITGMLHDADWEETTDKPEEHTVRLLSWLSDYDVPKEMIDVFRSHNQKHTGLKLPETILEWTLECCDELTGFIVAVALVMPDKKLKDVTVERVLKRFKQKEFAKAVDRDQILQCEEKLKISPDKFVGVTLAAMQKESEVLGL